MKHRLLGIAVAVLPPGDFYKEGLSMRRLFLTLVVFAFAAATARAAIFYTVTDLGTFHGRRINNNGQITGTDLTAGGELHAFVYDPVAQSMTDLATLGGQDKYTIRD